MKTPVDPYCDRGKWYPATAAVDAGKWALLVSSLLGVAYLLTVPLRAFSASVGP